MILGIKGFGIRDYFKGYFKNNQSDKVNTMTISIQAKTLSLAEFFNKKNSLRFLTLQIKGKLYIEEFAIDHYISGLLKIRYNGVFSIFIDFQGNCGNFYYLKGIFNPIKSIFSCTIFEKNSDIEIGKAKLLKESKKENKIIEKSIFWIK
ncbi:hypothetical protein JXR93_12270 [bacterium]|nr:hypothetical protein [bacterium]